MLPDTSAHVAPEPLIDAALRIDLGRYRQRLASVVPVQSRGRVRQVVGLLVEVEGVAGQLGELCHIERAGSDPVLAEIVGFRDARTLVMPFGELRGVQSGARVTTDGGLFTLPVGQALLGRVIDGLARPIDGRGPIHGTARQALAAGAPHALQRRNIQEPLSTGIRAIDAALTVGKGQRIGVFAGSGVGKSTVMAMIARYASSDVNVIALVGERGREVREFIERALGPEGLARSVVVVATSDEPALLKMQAAMIATTIAESFRAAGLDVTLLMDSVTRYAMANREIGLAIGEPPTMKGYPPSVFSALSRLLERAGTSDEGTITAFYAVLVESDDLTEPITDAVRGTLDGHIVLTRELAAQNHFPAIDLLQSTSRVMPSIVGRAHIEAAGRLRELLATYERSRDLVTIGAYQQGTDPRLDEALARLPAIEAFLRQRPEEAQPLAETLPQLTALVGLDAPAPLTAATLEAADGEGSTPLGAADIEIVNFAPEPAFVPAETE